MSAGMFIAAAALLPKLGYEAVKAYLCGQLLRLVQACSHAGMFRPQLGFHCLQLLTPSLELQGK